MVWFTDDLWEMMKLCWATQPAYRPDITVVLECLGQVSKTWKPPPPHVDEGGADAEEDDWNFTLTVNDSPWTFLASIRPRADHLSDSLQN